MSNEGILRLKFWVGDVLHVRYVRVATPPVNTEESSWETITTGAQIDRLKDDAGAIPTD